MATAGDSTSRSHCRSRAVVALESAARLTLQPAEQVGPRGPSGYFCPVLHIAAVHGKRPRKDWASRNSCSSSPNRGCQAFGPLKHGPCCPSFSSLQLPSLIPFHPGPVLMTPPCPSNPSSFAFTLIHPKGIQLEDEMWNEYMYIPG